MLMRMTLTISCLLQRLYKQEFRFFFFIKSEATLNMIRLKKTNLLFIVIILH